MSKNDEFNLRDLLGDVDDVPSMVPAIPDTPASELALPPKPKKEPKPSQEELLTKFPGLKTNAEERLSHPQPEPPKISLEDLSSPTLLSPDLKDETGELDEEYRLTFDATVTEVKDLEPEQLQALRHRLDRMIRRAKIQQRAIRVTEEGKLQFVEEKRRKAMRVKDSEFMSKRKIAQADGTETKAKSKSKDSGMSTVEKQVKQFCKLMMNEATIRATLTSLGTPIPSDLSEMIARHKK